MKKSIKKFLQQEAAAHNCKIVEIRENKHSVVRMQTQTGKTFCVTVSQSPSDHRAFQQIKKYIRRSV